MANYCMQFLASKCLDCAVLHKFADNPSCVPAECESCSAYDSLDCSVCAVRVLADLRHCRCSDILLGLNVRALNRLLFLGGNDG